MAKLTNVHTEKVFEDELCEHLASHGWTELVHLQTAKTYSRELALFPDDLLAFVQETQPKEWEKFKKWHNGQSEAIFTKRVAEQLDKHGTLHLLRHPAIIRTCFIMQGPPNTGGPCFCSTSVHVCGAVPQFVVV